MLWPFGIHSLSSFGIFYQVKSGTPVLKQLSIARIGARNSISWPKPSQTGLQNTKIPNLPKFGFLV
jgi:hypothetical protein